jgi:alpha-beta hydrolase superfamily lysophospholipase
MQTQYSKENEEWIEMTDGFKLYCRKWSASEQIDRSIIFFHGIEVHSGAFGFIGSELAKDGCEVYGFDRRGMGNSKEQNLPRGDTQSFGCHLKDIDEVVEFVRKKHPSKKLFVFGHSIGCAYALWYGTHFPQKIDGLILASPPLKTGFKVPFGDTLKLALSPAIHHHSMYNLIDEWPKIFKESEEYQLITNDNLCTKEFGLGFLFDVQTKLANKMTQNASKIEKPVLIIHGEQDIIALPESSKIILDKLASVDKILHTFEGEGANHWIYQTIIPKMGSTYDLEKKKAVSTTVKDWLNKH